MWIITNYQKEKIINDINNKTYDINKVGFLSDSDLLTLDTAKVFSVTKEDTYYKAIVRSDEEFAARRILLVDDTGSEQHIIAYKDTDITLNNTSKEFKFLFEAETTQIDEWLNDQLTELNVEEKVNNWLREGDEILSKYPEFPEEWNVEEQGLNYKLTYELLYYTQELTNKMKEINNWFIDNDIKYKYDNLKGENKKSYEKLFDKLEAKYMLGEKGYLTSFNKSFMLFGGCDFYNVFNIQHFTMKNTVYGDDPKFISINTTFRDNSIFKFIHDISKHQMISNGYSFMDYIISTPSLFTTSNFIKNYFDLNVVNNSNIPNILYSYNFIKYRFDYHTGTPTGVVIYKQINDDTNTPSIDALNKWLDISKYFKEPIHISKLYFDIYKAIYLFKNPHAEKITFNNIKDIDTKYFDYLNNNIINSIFQNEILHQYHEYFFFIDKNNSKDYFLYEKNKKFLDIVVDVEPLYFAENLLTTLDLVMFIVPESAKTALDSEPEIKQMLDNFKQHYKDKYKRSIQSVAEKFHNIVSTFIALPQQVEKRNTAIEYLRTNNKLSNENVLLMKDFLTYLQQNTNIKEFSDIIMLWSKTCNNLELLEDPTYNDQLKTHDDKFKEAFNRLDEYYLLLTNKKLYDLTSNEEFNNEDELITNKTVVIADPNDTIKETFSTTKHLYGIVDTIDKNQIRSDEKYFGNIPIEITDNYNEY